MKKREKVLLWLKETVESAVIALFLAFVIIVFVVQAFWIPSGSMEPNFYAGDRILAYKFLYHIDNVKQGDVIVFKYPVNPSQKFIKRAIGLPGDVIEIRNKKVYVNGKLLNEPYVVHADIWNSGSPRDEYGPITVPPDSLFVMGDNRDSSYDSRYWGFVPAKNIVGETFFRYWPPWRIKIVKGFSY